MGYIDLSEMEKIPFRIITAKNRARKLLEQGENLELMLKICIEKEYYCGAEGIKLVLEEQTNKSNCA